MARSKQKKRKTEEFEVKKDYIPDFLEALGELADLYEKEDDFRATAMRRAIIALEGQTITGLEDIKPFVLLGDLKGVGKGTLGMLEEFIEKGKIQRLEDMRPEEDPETVTPDELVSLFGHMTAHECSAMYEYWGECGQGSYDPDDEMYD